MTSDFPNNQLDQIDFEAIRFKNKSIGATTGLVLVVIANAVVIPMHYAAGIVLGGIGFAMLSVAAAYFALYVSKFGFTHPANLEVEP